MTPGYFDAIGVPILQGRRFDRSDVEGGAAVLIVSREMADRLWPRGDAIGAKVKYRDVVRTVVGIVGGVKHLSLDTATPFEMYTPHAQQPSYHTMAIVVRTRVDEAVLMPSIRRELSALDRDVPISRVATLNQFVAASTSEPRVRMLLLGAFAALAVLLAVVGVAGVIAYAVSRRTREIGVRVALGARAGDVIRLVLRQGMVPAVAGIGLGLAGAAALTRLLAGLLFGVTPLDVTVFAAATIVLGSAALAASYLPARRAASVDPMAALRAE
jgi:putative ABC transport system permease protein